MDLQTLRKLAGVDTDPGSMGENIKENTISNRVAQSGSNYGSLGLN